MDIGTSSEDVGASRSEDVSASTLNVGASSMDIGASCEDVGASRSMDIGTSSEDVGASSSVCVGTSSAGRSVCVAASDVDVGTSSSLNVIASSSVGAGATGSVDGTSSDSDTLRSVNVGTVLLLQELLRCGDPLASYQSIPGNTALLFGSIPLFGLASRHSAEARRSVLRSWHWRHFILSEASDEEDFRRTLRVPRRAFWKLLNIIEPDLIRKQTNWCVPLSPAIRLAVYLYYAGHGSSLQQLSGQFGIGRSTASGIIKCVSESIASRMENWICFPETRAELLDLSRAFEQTHRHPGCVAAIDGCHIPITQPAVNKSHKFYNRKGFYSINMSAAVDSRRRFLDVDIRWPGSLGDSRVFNNSELGRRHEDLFRLVGGSEGAGAMQVGWYACERVPFYLLADSAYANTRHVVTTYEIVEAQEDVVVARLNQKLAGMRYTVECAFGILKGRWRLLLRPIEMARTNLNSVPTVIGSLCILHNFLIEYGDTVWDEKEERLRKAYYDANYLAINSQGREISQSSTDTTQNGLLRWMRFFDSVRCDS